MKEHFKYILKDKKPVLVKDLLEWAIWMETESKIIEQTNIEDVFVSTIFLGLDCSFVDGVVILFETMVFGGKMNHYKRRYQTYEEATEGHKKTCFKVLKTFSIEPEALEKVIIKSLN